MFGFINCNKPPGMTSRDVVNIVARQIRGVKVGHCGTLDPLAEGVLVLGIGPAAKLVSFVQQYPKHYAAEFRLGVHSDSGDLEQPLIKHPNPPVVTRPQLQAAASRFIGQIEQVPPAYSAIWVDGKRAYDRVRKGEQVQIPSREVIIHSLDVVDFDDPIIKLRVGCGSGTYIRSVGIDLAAAVGTSAVMTHLQRTSIGPFQIETAVDLERLRNNPLDSFLLSATMGVEHLPKIRIDDAQAKRIVNGLPIDAISDPLNDPASGGVAAAIDLSGQLRGIVRGKTKQSHPAWYPEKVFIVNSV